MKKKLPKLTTDKGAEEFVAKADLADYDLSVLRRMHFKFQKEAKAANPGEP